MRNITEKNGISVNTGFLLVFRLATIFILEYFEGKMAELKTSIFSLPSQLRSQIPNLK